MKRIFTNARKHEFVSGTVTRKSQFKKNENKIQELESELSKIMYEADKDLSVVDLHNAEEVAQLNGKITSIKRKRGRLLSELNIVKINIEGSSVPSQANLDELCHFFPNANLKKIEEIEKFHYHIQEILKDEFLEETKRLNCLIDRANTEILRLEENIRKLDIPAKLSKSFLDKYSALESKINDLKTQNKAYIDFNIITALAKKATENLEAIQDRQLRCIESIVNYQMRCYNDFIYDAKRKSPVIDLDEGKKYSFQTPDDTGTGTSYKSLIIFDLSILKLTCLPAIAHDSLVFKNIGDDPINKIMELYMESDKEISYSDSTRKILNDTAVLYLNEGGDELFGCSWNKKEF